MTQAGNTLQETRQNTHQETTHPNAVHEDSVHQDSVHLLAVDDDKRLRTLLSRYLKDSGFRVSTVENVAEAEKALGIFQFDLVILDIMMPGNSGLTFLENAPRSPLPPVILLTAQSRTEERIQGLSLGADDYLVKPFDPRELLLRIQSILKRTRKKPDCIAFGSLVFNKNRDILERGEQVIVLTLNERKLLRFFVENREIPLSRQVIATALGETVSTRTVDVQVNRLRQKIEPFPSSPRYLQSVRGQGYILRVAP